MHRSPGRQDRGRGGDAGGERPRRAAPADGTQQGDGGCDARLTLAEAAGAERLLLLLHVRHVLRVQLDHDEIRVVHPKQSL